MRETENYGFILDDPEDFYNIDKFNENFEKIDAGMKENADCLEAISASYVAAIKGEAETSYRNGEVTLKKSDIGLENVDNTSDLNKPISQAAQEAFDTKVDKTNVLNKLAAVVSSTNTDDIAGANAVKELNNSLGFHILENRILGTGSSLSIDIGLNTCLLAVGTWNYRGIYLIFPNSNSEAGKVVSLGNFINGPCVSITIEGSLLTLQNNNTTYTQPFTIMKI